MENSYSVLLNVWREACRHIELKDSIPIITSLLQHDLKLEQVLVKRVLFDSYILETVALGFPHHEIELSRRHECSEDEMQKLKQLMRSPDNFQLLYSSSMMNGYDFLLHTKKKTGAVMVCPLIRDEINGLLFFIAPSGHTFDEHSMILIKALQEPFSVAMENDTRLLELNRLRKAAEADKRALLSRLGREEIVDTIIGETTGLKAVIERINLVAASDMPALIFGETGTGKELIARRIHYSSARSGGPFLRVNCGAIPPELIDSQLFGHEKGSFTGAVSEAPGWFERADGGTLFLDEIGELPFAAQVRFLRVLQDGWFERVGGHRSVHVDVRVIAATNQDLAAMVASGRFREDLWYRIAVFPVVLPPLRQRKEDIPALTEHFVKRAACRFKLNPVMPTEDDIALLRLYNWPGNVREFASVIDRAVILGNGKTLEIRKSLGWIGEYTETSPKIDSKSHKPEQPRPELIQKLDDITRLHIERILHQTNGRIDGPHGAAVILGINPHTLRGRMRKLGIDWKSKRNSPTKS